MTKMATPLYGETPLKIQKADDLGTWYVGWGYEAYQICSKDDPRLTLTYLKSRSNLLPNAFEWEKLKS